MELIAAGIFADGTVRYKYGSINSITDPLQLPTGQCKSRGAAANQLPIKCWRWLTRIR